MKQYVDGFVIPVPNDKLDAYKQLASDAGKLWMKHGALQYVECVAEDLDSAAQHGCLPFTQLAGTKAEETVIFAFIVYESRQERDRVNSKVMQEMENDSDQKDLSMPFDMKRMAVGGFETMVNLQAE